MIDIERQRYLEKSTREKLSQMRQASLMMEMGSLDLEEREFVEEVIKNYENPFGVRKPNKMALQEVVEIENRPKQKRSFLQEAMEAAADDVAKATGNSFEQIMQLLKTQINAQPISESFINSLKGPLPGGMYSHTFITPEMYDSERFGLRGVPPVLKYQMQFELDKKVTVKMTPKELEELRKRMGWDKK